MSFISNIFPNILPDKYIIGIVITLQGLLAMRFILKRNPNINSEIDNVKLYKIKSLIVIATSFLSWVLFVVLLGLFGVFKVF
jgi:hypothetical protein